MGRKRPESKHGKLIKAIMEDYQPETGEDVQNILKDLTAELLEGMLKAELDDHMEYDYGDKPLSINTRNGYNNKTVKGSSGEIDIKVPRDRNSTFEPKVVKKYDKDISNIEGQIISMYGRGMTTRDISAHIEQIYGFGVSESTVSKITNKILPTIEEWRQRPLDRVYPFVFMDAIHYNVRDNGVVVKKAVYVVLDYTMDGVKEVLGMYVGENETSKYWLMVLNDLKNRGLEDVLIFSTDNLSGFSEAITAVYPKSEIQKCIIHQIRSSTRYVNYKDRKELVNDLKTIYKANTEQIALVQLDFFDEKWKKKYPNCVASWRTNWSEISTFFKYPPEIRKLIYTTNSIENFNRQLRKVTKNKSIFPTDFSLEKSLYLAMANASEKWSTRMRGWDRILAQLNIFFEDILSV